jgi:hypothetical protein
MSLLVDEHDGIIVRKARAKIVRFDRDWRKYARPGNPR